MTPVMQEHFRAGARRGDCLRAAIASLLDLPAEAVPHFTQIEADGGQPAREHLIGWLWQRDHLLVPVDEPRPGEHYLAIGPSPRGPWQHAVVHRDGALAHDPHPAGGGLLAVAERWAIRPLEGESRA